MKKLLVCSFEFIVIFFLFLLLPTTNSELTTIHAVVDPLSVPNNKFGIHIIQATPDESSPAASLVNSSGGDWGYLTVLIEGRDKNQGKWQEFFNDLRRRHLIPLVRLATIPDGPPVGGWKRPDIGEAIVWASFLDSLNWPTKNRYVIIYNEPNHGSEWGNNVDAKDYARFLYQTINALKSKSQDFFVLNAGLDASAPNILPNYQDEVSFMQQMNNEVPGIFDKLDGWVSHSYPNPGFVGSPDAFGRGTVRTWFWELQQLRNLGVSKQLPVFITETGWKHAEGLSYDFALPGKEVIANYYQNAFENAWNSERIVAVTPFVLSYQETPFDHFSFKKINTPEYYAFFDTIKNLPKTAGKPIQQHLAKLTGGEIFSSIVAGETYTILLKLKNTGQSIWNDQGTTTLVPLAGGPELGIERITIPKEIKIEPGKEYSFRINLKAPQKGSFKIKLNLFSENKQFESAPLEFTTEVKLPVILQVLTRLRWKNSAAGDYILKISGAVGNSQKNFTLNTNGQSTDLEARYILPDYSFEFRLEKTYYHPKTIHQVVRSGVNVLDFDALQPNLLPAILHPAEFWKLLPWSK